MTCGVKYIFMLSVFCTLMPSYGQYMSDPVKENAIDRVIETLVENSDLELDYTTLLEKLNEAYEHPVNLNTVTREDLEQLILLSDVEMDALMNYLEKHGPMISIYELLVVPSWDEETIYLLLPFITVAPVRQSVPYRVKDVFTNSGHEFILRYAQVLEPQKGFEEPADTTASRYLGSPYQLYFRYRFTFRDKVSFGITAKKDRGEEFFKGTQPYGFDFYSGHLFIRDLGVFESVAVGDYQVQFGQGLNVWTGLGTRKSMFTNNLRRFPAGLKPYTSANPFMFNRGMAATLKYGRVRATGFFSYKQLDGTPQQVDSAGYDVLEVRAIDESGYHRTPGEVSRRNSLSELFTGGNINYKAKKWSVGITGSYTRYSAAVQPDTLLYQRYAFRGDQAFNAGVDYAVLAGRVYLFGEVGVSGNGGYAFLQGIEAPLHPALSVSFLYREYARDYQNPHSAAFGDKSDNRNERGWYMGFEAAPFRKFRLNGYMDVFQFPWLRFNVDRPSWGYDALVQVTYLHSRKTELLFRFRHSMRQENAVAGDGYTQPLADVHRSSLRLHFTHDVNGRLKLRSRVEAVFISRPDKDFAWGFVAYQDVAYRFVRFPLDVSARFAVFRTDGYNTRIYAYENDVLYSFSVPAYYDRGMRFYVNLRYQAIRGLSIWFRVAMSYYLDQAVIGSGLDEINGNTRTEVKVQVRYRFSLRPHKKQLPQAGD